MSLNEISESIGRLKDELLEKADTEFERLKQTKKVADDYTTYYAKIIDDPKNDPVLRAITSQLVRIQNYVITDLIKQVQTLNYLTMLSLSVDTLTKFMAYELMRLEHPSVQVDEQSLAKIGDIEKDLNKLKHRTEQWKPYINYLKEGKKRTEKYFREKR